MKHLDKLIPIILGGIVLVFLYKWSKDGTLSGLVGKVTGWINGKTSSVPPAGATANAIMANPVGAGSLVGPIGVSSSPRLFGVVSFIPNQATSTVMGLSPYDSSFWSNPQLAQNSAYYTGQYTNNAISAGAQGNTSPASPGGAFN